MSEAKYWSRLGARRMGRRRLLSMGARAGVGAAGLALVGCGDDDDDESVAAAPTEPAPAAPAPAAEPTTVSFALDWVPNTNHTGFHVADARGYYEEAGVKINILPYTTVSPDTLVGAGQADFGISFGTSIPFSSLAGLPIASVLPILQRPASALVFRTDSGIASPADLDGKLYAGFGAPYEGPIISSVIEADGGAGDFETVTLNTFAYEAVNSGDADFAWAFVTWEGVEFALRGARGPVLEV